MTGITTVEEFEHALNNARCEADCERLLRIVLPHMRCTESERDDLAGKAMARRFHFALTAEGSRGTAVAQSEESFAE